MGEEYKEWMRRARSNLEIAKRSKGKEICYEDLCFEAQQSAEKALKALMIYYKQPIPKVHSFHVLLERAERYVKIPEEIKEVIELSDYAVQTRYPGDYTPVDEKEYKRAVKIAEKIFNWVFEIVKRGK